MAFAQQAANQDLTKLNIEDLMKIEVTTASKSEQALSDVAAAIYVISEEDIRRSGAMNIPEALRLAPGVIVSQVSASEWMVSIRGFNGLFADKLLVLMDGRSVYTPLKSGVFWDDQDIPLEDIARIEVIRGPGGSLWGANAVNGIINIITKSASETQGSMFSSELGTDLKTNSTYQFGAKLSKDAFYRVYAKYLQRGPLDLDGEPGPDRADAGKFGFRIDDGKSSGDHYMILGDIRSGHLKQGTDDFPGVVSYSTTEGDLVARWERTGANGAGQLAQGYYDHTSRLTGIAPAFYEKRDTINLDYQNRLPSLGRNTFTFGAGYRRSSDKTRTGAIDSLTPRSKTLSLYSLFGQDTLDLKKNWKLQVGSKFEHNDFTGWEVQPSARIIHTPTPQRTLWASVSRAVRTPDRLSRGLRAELFPLDDSENPPVAVLFGSEDFKSETVTALEVGSRMTMHENVFLDLTAFYNKYEHLETIEPGDPFDDNGQTVYPFTLANKAHGDTAGFEAALKTKLKPWWNVSTSLSLFTERLRFDPGSLDSGIYDGRSARRGGRGGAAKTQFQLHSYMNLPNHFEFDNDLYYVDALISGRVPAYFKLDSRIGLQVPHGPQLSLGVRNALGARHLEASDPLGTIEEVSRSFYFKAAWRF